MRGTGSVDERSLFLNYNHLYKYNRIYHLYKAVDNTWHIESYPIVYMNSLYVYFIRPGRRSLEHKVNNSCYNDWRMVFDQAAKDRIKRDYEEFLLIHPGITEFIFDGGYYLNVDVSDAKNFCKTLSKPDSCAAITLELAECKTWLNRYACYEEEIRKKKERIKELEEQLRNEKGIES